MVESLAFSVGKGVVLSTVVGDIDASTNGWSDGGNAGVLAGLCNECVDGLELGPVEKFIPGSLVGSSDDDTTPGCDDRASVDSFEGGSSGMASIGLGLGNDEGSVVGPNDGANAVSTVGWEDGTIAGLFEGTSDGESDGFGLGIDVGSNVGASLGIMLGRFDGPLDGLSDALTDGYKLGI
jgi:hypothetical protein